MALADGRTVRQTAAHRLLALYAHAVGDIARFTEAVQGLLKLVLGRTSTGLPEERIVDDVVRLFGSMREVLDALPDFVPAELPKFTPVSPDTPQDEAAKLAATLLARNGVESTLALPFAIALLAAVDEGVRSGSWEAVTAALKKELEPDGD